MAQIFALILAGTNVLLAMAVFVFLARPQIGTFVVGWFLGRKVALDPNDLEQEEAWLSDRNLARRISAPLVALVFLWSFLSGVVIGWVRL